MKQGRTLSALAAEIERQQAVKRDFVVPTKQMQLLMRQSGETPMEVGSNIFRVSDISHKQIGERLEIGGKYYDRMRKTAPQLLVTNVNHWLHKTPETRLVRTMDGTMRAFLSNRYRRLDNIQVLTAAMPALQEVGDLEVGSCEVTEQRLYLKILFPKFEGDIGKGDMVRFGLNIRNSEIGMGSLDLSLYAETLACLNGMTVEHGRKKRNHIGRMLKSDDVEEQTFTDETLQADDKAFFLKLRDSVKMLLREETFREITRDIKQSRGESIEGDVTEVVKELGQRVGYSEGEGAGILKHLISGADLSQWGMISAVTRYAQDVADYDRSDELEEIGGKILSLDPGEWRKLAA